MNVISINCTRCCWLDDLLSETERGEEILWARGLERGAVYATDVIVVAVVMGAVTVAAAVVALTAALPENCCYNAIFIKVAIQLHNYPKYSKYTIQFKHPTMKLFLLH